MISDEYIRNLKRPLCPICGQPMEPDHDKLWSKEKEEYHDIRFYCSSQTESGNHYLVLSATSPEQWAGTCKRWKLEFQSDAPAAADGMSMAVLGEH